MMSRGSILAISIMLSIIVHGALLAVSPVVTIFRPISHTDDLLRSFRVQLVSRDDAMPPDPMEEGVGPLESGPGAIEDLLRRERERLDPGDAEFEPPIDVARLAERLAQDPIEREHDLTPDEDLLREVDTRLIEISQDDVREEVEVARRYVRPSPISVLDGDVLPTLRGPGDLDPDQLTLIDPLSLGGGRGGGFGDGENDGPPREDDVLEPEEDEDLLLLAEQELGLEDIEEEIQREAADYTFLDDLVQVRLDTFVQPGEPLGYFRLQIYPRDDIELEPLPKDVTFVVDASRNIQQPALDQTVEGIAAVIEEFRPEDRFNIVVFRDTTNQFRPELVPATEENKRAAVEYLSQLEARGSTDFYAALRPVVTADPREGVPKVIMVISDGRPTSGVVDARTIINNLTDFNEPRNSVFAFGGGRTVDQYMLDLLSFRNKGEAYVTPQIDSIRYELPSFFSRLQEPILVDCRANFGRIDRENIFPRELPDFYRGQVVTVYGRFDPATDQNFAMRLTGKAQDQQKEVVFMTDFDEARRGDNEIARNWALRRIYYLIGETTRVGERPELLAEIRSLSRQYNIRTSYDQ